MAADEVLSQDEVESLLNSIDAESRIEARSTRPEALASGHGHEKIAPYDFKRPERVGKEQMRALQSLHENFSRNFAAALSGLLRSIVEVKLANVDQLTYSEFIFSLENPTCLNLIDAPPLEGRLLLDINPAILFPILDRLLGGGKERGPFARRPLTEIERRLVARITRSFLEELKRAWENVVELDLSVDRIESNPQLVQVVPPNEVVVLTSFELTLGDTRGMMNLCIPFNSIDGLSAKLVANGQPISGQPEGSFVEMIVTLAETNVTTTDLLGLCVGDIITTDHDVRQPLDVAIEGVSKFQASPGTLKGRKAIQVKNVLGSSAQ